MNIVQGWKVFKSDNFLCRHNAGWKLITNYTQFTHVYFRPCLIKSTQISNTCAIKWVRIFHSNVSEEFSLHMSHVCKGKKGQTRKSSKFDIKVCAPFSRFILKLNCTTKKSLSLQIVLFCVHLNPYHFISWTFSLEIVQDWTFYL